MVLPYVLVLETLVVAFLLVLVWMLVVLVMLLVTMIVVVVMLMVIFEKVGIKRYFSDTTMSTAPLVTFTASGHGLNVQESCVVLRGNRGTFFHAV